jgi:hypothetical protein
MANEVTRTNDLKKLIQTKLKTLATNVYFEEASDNALYPHIVFAFRTIDLGDLARQDYILEVDIWDKGTSTTQVDELSDKVEDLLQAKNLPQTNILPTFYKIDRKSIKDEDKSIKHRLIKFQIQNYVR